MRPTGRPTRFSTVRWKAAIALSSLVLSIGACEALLRWALFHTSIAFAAKDPAFYARTLDEAWIYRGLFARDRAFAAADQPGGMRDSSIAFYRAWATSLQPDATLGYARKPDVKVPCHETTALGTRGLRDYSADGPKLVFLGDSFVESAACSNDTLTTRLEGLTGIDTLNYGVGGYGLDQILLSFERVAPRFDRPDCLILVGLIQDDLDRILLTVRSGPKPYFTMLDERLVLHTGHIHPIAPDDERAALPARSYLYDFLRGALGHPVQASFLAATREQRRTAVADLSQRLFERFVEARDRRYALAFVIFPTPGAPFDDSLLAPLRSRGVPVVDLQFCLRRSGRLDTALYAELHPTSLGNTLLAQCLVDDLRRRALLR